MKRTNIYRKIYQNLLEETTDKLFKQMKLSKEDLGYIQQIKFFCEEMLGLNNFNINTKECKDDE